MEHYSTLKKNGILIHATSWMILENVMLSERSQIQRTNIVKFYYEELRIDRTIETESRREVIGAGGGQWGLTV